MSAYLAYALTAQDRRDAFLDGTLRFRAWEVAEAPRKKMGRPRLPGQPSVKSVALRYIAGEFPDMTYPQIGAREKVNAESLRAMVYFIRRQTRIQ
jgi:hypothetical protein